MDDYAELACAVVEADRELAIDLLAVIDGLGSVQTSNPMVLRLRAFRECLDTAQASVGIGIQAETEPR